MPVVYAVQMTGSFPVAFESQKWNQDWGKYYIHYNSTRREIDLTGHNFTDGGMLSNFPIKYLDNENMRPMYFSHQPNKLTKLYGFGLYEIPSKGVDLGGILKSVLEQVGCSLVCHSLCPNILKFCRCGFRKKVNFKGKEG